MSLPNHFTRLRQAGIVAVVRADGPDQALQVVAPLLEGGVCAIELTFTTPGAADALMRAKQTYGDALILGAGSIREVAQVEAARQAGVDFLVSSHVRADVLAAMLATGLPSMPGVFTPTEVGQALDLGAEAVKLFPASTGGPGHLRALRGPFPGLEVIPTGGIDVGDIATWFKAGAFAVGVGGELVPRNFLAEARWDEVRERARRFVDAAAAARGGGAE